MADEDVGDGVALLVIEAVLAVPHPPEVGGRRGRLGAAAAHAADGVRVVGGDLVAAAAAAVVLTNAQAAVSLTIGEFFKNHHTRHEFALPLRSG